MSGDKLAEALAQAAAEATGDAEHCEHAVVPDARNPWEEFCVLDWDAVAVAAREHIGDEIARYSRSKPFTSIRFTSIWRAGLCHAESIARGDTK